MEIKTYNVSLKSDYLNRYSSVSPIKGIEEAIWNGLDADATEIHIKFRKNEFGKLSEVIVEDNGHGIDIDKVESEFTTLGGSFKKTSLRSPNNRKYHGSQGAGRIKLASIGNDIEINSTYYNQKSNKYIDILILIKSDNLNEFKVLGVKDSDNRKTGTRIKIFNLTNKSTVLTLEKAKDDILEIFTAYSFSYPDFQIIYDGEIIDFKNNIKNIYNEDFTQEINGIVEQFTVKIIEWKKHNTDKKICFCDADGIMLEDNYHKLRLQLPISIYILSDYFSKIKDEILQMNEMHPQLISISDKAKSIAKQYDLEQIHEQAKEYIIELKKEDIYPYKNEPKTVIEKIEQQVFDVTALQLKKYLPVYSDKTKTTKREKTKDKITLSLIKEAISSSPSVLSKILNAVIGLSSNEQADFAELLERTTLSAIINTSKEISDRLLKLEGFKDIILGEHKDKILERKHLQKLLEQEYWIFGDNYQMGAADNTLKTVLKKYLKYIGREDFEEVIIGEENSEKIPDICLWKQYKKDYSGNKENLIIEIKKPSLVVGMNEVMQIQTYANKIVEDSAFPKEKTFWTFYLLTNEYDHTVAMACNQRCRESGLYIDGENYKVYIKQWSEILNDVEARLSYIQEKLNLQAEESEGVELLKRLHPDYLPNFDNENL